MTAFLVGLLPAAWLGFSLWTPFNLLRTLSQGGFYDLQARAIMHGHLWVPRNSLNIEGFIHNGKTYPYFGVFPSLIRIPILFVTDSLDGRLTALSVMVAYVVSFVVMSMLLWRLRVTLRGTDFLGRGESLAYGLLLVALTAGSVFMNLLATPRVYEEDVAWSIALTMLALFAFLGLLERVSNARLALTFVAVVSVATNRGSTGDACIAGALTLAAWLYWKSSDPRGRRAALIVSLTAGVAVACVMWCNEIKFGNPFSYDMHEQVWTTVSAHRREFLKVNGTPFGAQFLWSNLWAYLRLDSFHPSFIFPFVTLPLGPSAVLGRVYFDMTYPTLSLPVSMPFPFALGVAGVLTVLWRRAHPDLARLRPLVATVILAAVPVLIYGYVSFRYLSDFVPLTALASMIMLVWWWPEFRRRASRNLRVIVAVVSTLTTGWGVVVNVASSAMPIDGWTKSQTAHFVSVQNSWSLSSLSASVLHRSRLPLFAPVGSLVAVNGCDGLYLSTQFASSQVPRWDAMHLGWIALSQPAQSNRFLWLVQLHPITVATPPITLLTRGTMKFVAQPVGDNQVRFVLLGVPGVAKPLKSRIDHLVPGHSQLVGISLDPYLNYFLFNGPHVILGPSPVATGVTVINPVSGSPLVLRGSASNKDSVNCHKIVYGH